MKNHRHGRMVGGIAAAGLATLALGGGGAFALTGTAAAPPKITGKGVGAVKVGRTFAELRDDGLVGPLRKGCELGGPKARSARLKAPLEGTVNFSLTSPRKVTDVTISGGAKARGVGIGATIPQIKAAFPKAKVSKTTEETFGLWLVDVPKNGGGRIVFAVDAKAKRITLIGVPFVAFCE